MARITVLLTTFFLLAHAYAGASPLGRLFFSPEERASLDQIRNRPATDNTQMEPTPIEKTTLNGLVRRSNGKTTIWINQIPQHKNETQGHSSLKESNRSPAVPLRLPSGKKVRLKPGQTFDTLTDKVREGYEDTADPLPAEVTK